MTHAIPGHSAPAVGFEVPLEMLAACHGRVQHQCATLQRLLPHLQRHGADRDAQDAARAIMRYFDSGVIVSFQQIDTVVTDQAVARPMRHRAGSDWRPARPR